MNKQPLETARRRICSLGQFMQRVRTRTYQPPQRHRVYMSFVRNPNGWHCRFHQDDPAKTPISRKFAFSSAEKIHEAARRGNGLLDIESQHALIEAVNVGRGGVWLHLTEDQYEALIVANPSHAGRN